VSETVQTVEPAVAPPAPLPPGSTIQVGPWTWTVWPTLPLPTAEWLAQMGATKGPSWLHEFHGRREKQIANEQFDPMQYGWESPPMKTLRELLAGTYVPGKVGEARVKIPNPKSQIPNPDEWIQKEPANDILALGGNGSGKTDSEAKIAMEVLEQGKYREARCFSQNEQTSVRYIQRAMYKYIRPELRKVKRQGQTTKISYQESTGFSENIFVLPNHSVCVFPTYKAWQQDRQSVEGGECHVLTWDEEMPGECLETVRYRAHKTGGFVLGGFTPLNGYTDTVAQYLEGMTILETIPARDVVWDWWTRTWTWGEWLLPKDRELVKGCPPGHVPYVLQSGAGKGRRFVVLFPTPFNPYTNVRAILDSTTGAPLDFALERLWGWPTRLARKAFPNFGAPHIVKDASRVPAPSEMCLSLWMDPHGDRNWFIDIIGVDAQERVWLLKEWPDISMGEWALPGQKPDGKAGPAQYAGGNKSFNDYKRTILELIGWAPNSEGVWVPGPNALNVRDYYMDPRPAGTSVPSDEDAETYLDHMAKPILNAHGQVLFPGFDFSAAPHCGIEDGKQLIGDLLTHGWDPRADITPLNCPKFYVWHECENSIWALRTWTGADGEKGACKDPIDVLKGAAKLPVRYLPPGTLGSYGGWGGH
jgi:phage terminase large subunit-like protein